MAQNRKYRDSGEYDWTMFRANLRRLMDSRGLNGKETAEAVGLAPTTVTRYLTERTPDSLAIWKICDFFDVSVDWLLGRETSMYASLPEEVRKFAENYAAASLEDKAIIDMILKKYEIR